MTKFQEMCAAFAESRDSYFAYQNACILFASDLERKFIEHCSIPHELLRLVPLNEKPKDGTIYTPAGAMYLDDDIFWHLGVQLTLYSAPNQFPYQPVLMVFCIKKEADRFLVRFGTNGPDFIIEPSCIEGYLKLFDHVTSQIKDYFSGRLQRFLECSGDIDEVRKIGFV